ncbi:hypothetical protein HNQ80_000029 [Anaerosolibacter carboniphilus]|uniref:Uncharacterized protein n=1 Tax=Anaerosolibacter carboniphilus TaxID=1417629 RepID=A0A841KPD1_9FIRM|nr:hypothetical protein [Anaerosolibacter carboniphilus]MBB6213960.1 hypothetical protein [Anaerosolibacter carboniphilus]
MIFQSTLDAFDTPTMESIEKQALLYSFSNVFSLALLSDMGISADFSEEIYDKLHKLLPGAEDSSSHSIDLNYALFPLRAVYSRGNLGFADMLGALNAEKKDLHWNKEHFKKNISPLDQALLINSEIQLSKYLYHHSLSDSSRSSSGHEKFIGLLFLHGAMEQGEFCHQHLRNNQGLFIEKKDKSKYKDHILLKTKDHPIRWLDQIHMMHAYASLCELLNDYNHYPNYYDTEQASYFGELSSQILHVLCHQEDDLYDLKTKDLTFIIPLLVKTAHQLHQQEALEPLVIKLCAELSAREVGGGKLSRDRQGLKISSLATHGRAITALIEGYKFTQYDRFYGEAKKLYHYLNSRWNGEINLFGHNKRKKIKYSAMDIASILNGLQSLLSVETNANNTALLRKQLCAFFNSSINISGIQVSPPSISELSNMRSMGNLDPVSPDLLMYEENSCVFTKEFKINPKRDRIYLQRDHYETQQALYAALVLSNLCSKT